MTLTKIFEAVHAFYLWQLITVTLTVILEISFVLFLRRGGGGCVSVKDNVELDSQRIRISMSLTKYHPTT